MTSAVPVAPLPDALARFMGITVERLAPGQTAARAVVDGSHLNPHGTAHGVFIYAVAGVALAAAANDETHSGVMKTVHIDYVSPARVGDELVARARVIERLPAEDLYEARVVRAATDELVARASGRASRRGRPTGSSG